MLNSFIIQYDLNYSKDIKFLQIDLKKYTFGKNYYTCFSDALEFIISSFYYIDDIANDILIINYFTYISSDRCIMFKVDRKDLCIGRNIRNGISNFRIIYSNNNICYSLCYEDKSFEIIIYNLEECVFKSIIE